MDKLKKINIPINKLLQKYDLQFTREGKSKMGQVYLFTTAFVSFILSEEKCFNENQSEEILKEIVG